MNSINQYLPRRLLEKAAQLEVLTHQLHCCLPIAWRPHAQVANIREGELIILVDSPAWATRLRLHSPFILTTLSDYQNLNIQKISIKQRPSRQPAPKSKLRARELSPESAKLLRQTADSIDDAKLKEALHCLSRCSAT